MRARSDVLVGIALVAGIVIGVLGWRITEWMASPSEEPRIQATHDAGIATLEAVVAPTATAAPTGDPWAVYAGWMLNEASNVESLMVVLDCPEGIWPPLSPAEQAEADACWGERTNQRNRADRLYQELENHAWPTPGCAVNARNQLAYALDDLRWGRPEPAATHLELARMGLFCSDLP